MRIIIMALLVVTLFSGAMGGPVLGESRPNVLLIMTDDQGWGDLRSHGNDKIDTPVQDMLATQGANFDRFYVSPVCAPTRASLLTGRYHLRTGTCGVTRGYETMRGEEVTIAEVLKNVGYATGCFGKWHNGAHYPHHPNGQGFDEFFGFCAGHWNNYFDTHLERNGEPVKVTGFITDVLTDATLGFIEKHKDHPFFCYIPYNAPHEPYQVPDRYFDKYKNRGLDNTTAAIYGMIENVDDNLGRLLRKLDDLKLANDTIVLFLTDNGPQTQRYNGGMKGHKGQVDEGGARVPLFVRWPGKIEPGITIKQIAAHIDLLPTIVELCGLSNPRTLPLDGISLVPLLRGQSKDWPDRMIVNHQAWSGHVALAQGAVRTQQYRLVYDGATWQLYDMLKDPGQKKNVAEWHPKITEKLRHAYEAWFKDVTIKGNDRIPIPVGYVQSPIVELLAPECYMAGHVHYMGRDGWANDWITGWESTDDAVWWDIDVVAEGRYEVTLMYTCSEQDIGSKVRVDVGDRSVEGVIEHAHDPEPVPSPDRVPRMPVYEKIWAPLMIGTLELDKGRSQLTVKALTKPGRQVFDLKAVCLQRVD